MKTIFKLTFLLPGIIFLLTSCEIVKDETLPEIDMTAQTAFPQSCVTVYRGESFTFRATLKDNVELGSFGLEMHNNFDHHAHSTSIVECEEEADKTAVNPFLYLEDFELPSGLKTYDAHVTINIPASVDKGDYHFEIRLTDKAGWQIIEAYSVKVADRN
jgi:hypothetical protein